MISVGEAFDRLLHAMPEPEREMVPLTEAQGRRLAVGVTAGRDQPALDLSAMDGYAIAADEQRREWRVAGIAAAGAKRERLSKPEECIEIITGAPVPLGADTVIPVEQVKRSEETMRLADGEEYTPGRHIRGAGSDYTAGAELLSEGEMLTSASLAVLAAEGVVEVPVARRLTAAVLSTGSELVQPGEKPEPHQIDRKSTRLNSSHYS